MGVVAGFSSSSTSDVTSTPESARREIDRLRGELAKRHTLSYSLVSAIASTGSGGGSVVNSNSFLLDGAVIQPKWTKSGLRVGCHTITREALEALSKLEE